MNKEKDVGKLPIGLCIAYYDVKTFIPILLERPLKQKNRFKYMKTKNDTDRKL
jgi:hypothetical protein